MKQMPAGVVTFVFTDVEGSTRLQAKLGAAARELIDTQAAIVIDAFESAGGHFVDRTGDGLLLAFADPAAAIGACVNAQLALLRHAWPAEGRVLVRMGMHTGPAEPVNGNYTALAVNQGARVVDTAHGGQVVVSEETMRGIDSLSEPMTLAPLGTYRVRDFDQPIALFEVRHPQLPVASVAVRAPRLFDEVVPARRTAFVGRETELEALGAALAENRLVTLAGPSGVGKTRLAVELAGSVPAAWMVDLASAEDSSAVPAAIAGAIGVRALPGADPVEAVAERLGKTEALLVLDNCEHVLVAAARAVDRLLTGAPGVRILATSQAPLQVSGERLMRLAPLGLPPTGNGASSESILASDSARLFIERARAADTGFTYDPSDAPWLARVCRALDGLPLALELAATRVRALGLKELAERIDDRFSLLSGGGGSGGMGPARHATLRAAIEWSYGPLGETSRRLLRRVSVFRGSFTIPDAEAVAGEPVLEDLITLVDWCLAQREAGTSPARFRLLESIRAFAAGELRKGGEEKPARDRHLAWCRDLARNGAIAADYVGDVDAALAWAGRDPSRVAVACELAEQIVPHPGAVPLDLLTARVEGLLCPELDAPTRVRVLGVGAELALRVGSPARERLALELVEASRNAGVGLAKALLLTGSAAASHGRFDEALGTLDEAAAHAQAEADDVAGLHISLRTASVRLELGQEVIDPLRAVVSAMRERRDPTLPIALNNLAIAYERAGKMPESLAAHTEALALRRAAGDTMGEVTTLVNAASVLVRSGRFAEARARLLEVLGHPTVRHNMLRLAAICGTAGELLAAEGNEPHLAARLLGAHQRIREHHGRERDAQDDAQYQPYVSTLIAALGQDAYDEAFREGHDIDPELALDVVSVALSKG